MYLVGLCSASILRIVNPGSATWPICSDLSWELVQEVEPGEKSEHLQCRRRL